LRYAFLSLFAPLPLCIFALNLFFVLRVLRVSVVQLFAFSAPRSPVAAVNGQCCQAATRSPIPAVLCKSSANAPYSRRRKLAVQRQHPVFPPFIPAAILAIFAFALNRFYSALKLQY
jgi:hypothetical protein